jgi:glucoamylase
VWDEIDRPEQRLFLGGHTGAAMPLMWAHAEYIKLLRSASEGKTFDLIPAVVDRYQNRRRCMLLEIWKPNRRVRTMEPGATLRIQAPDAFRLHWSQDGWKTTHDTPARATALDIYYVDIPAALTQSGSIRFTLFWTGQERWESRDYQVDIQKPS